MAGIAGIVYWDQRPVAGELIDRMLAVVRHRGPDGLNVETHGGVGFGHARFALSDVERSRTQPVWLPDRACGLVADVRLYNRLDLLNALGNVPWFMGSPTDAQIVLAAYERWNMEAVQRLRGDFAFAIWDGRIRKIFAARDAFGVKPLFYVADRRRLCFGSEAKQLLVVPGVQTKPNDAAVAELLVTGRASAREATFFENVMRLRPGHCLEAGENGERTWRWWDPARRVAGPTPIRAEPYAQRFYELFRDSVERRLDTTSSIALELSGGYDSSSVVAVAAELKARVACPLPKIVTISHCYPGLPCDEREFIDAVLENCPFPAIRFDAPVADYTSALDRELRKIDAPYLDLSWARRALGASHLAAEGCRVVLTGLGADELIWDPDYDLDLWRDGHYLRSIRHCLRDPRVLRDAAQRQSIGRLARFAAPQWLKDRMRRFIRHGSPGVPDWITPMAVAMASQCDRAGTGIDSRFPSLAQASIHGWLASPSFHWFLESEELLAAHHGFELRHPFLDQDLVEFVLAIPWQARHAQPGSFKTLLVTAMGERLPLALRDRNRKATFDTYFTRLEEGGYASLDDELFAGDRWVSRRFTDRAGLEQAQGRVRKQLHVSYDVRQRLWLAEMIELWLRTFGSEAAT